METIWFNWKTNIDYIDLLSREIVKNDVQIKRAEFKRIQGRIKRKNRQKALKRKI